jgi:hypothetical protein
VLSRQVKEEIVWILDLWFIVWKCMFGGEVYIPSELFSQFKILLKLFLNKIIANPSLR